MGLYGEDIGAVQCVFIRTGLIGFYTFDQLVLTHHGAGDVLQNLKDKYSDYSFVNHPMLKEISWLYCNKQGPMHLHRALLGIRIDIAPANAQAGDVLSINRRRRCLQTLACSAAHHRHHPGPSESGLDPAWRAFPQRQSWTVQRFERHHLLLARPNQ